MVDAHCHLNFKAFEKDLDEVIDKAKSLGVDNIVVVGADLESSRKAVEIANNYENVCAVVGIHPHHADKLDPSVNLGLEKWIEELEELAKDIKVIGIGECGLDYYSYKSNGITDKEFQKKLFIEQIRLAYKLKLPLQIHNRQAGNDIIDILINHKSYLINPPGMFHCFSGDTDFLQKVLDLGFYIGFDGNITYTGIAKGETCDLKDLVKYVPIDRIITETDSPYLSPVPLKGLRNTPVNVIMVGEFIAGLKNTDKLKFWEQVVKNFKDVFKNIKS